jgi:hypothetical protein
MLFRNINVTGTSVTQHLEGGGIWATYIMRPYLKKKKKVKKYKYKYQKMVKS